MPRNVFHCRTLLVAICFCLGLLCGPSVGKAEEKSQSNEPFFEVTELFKAGESGYRTFRVPSIVMTPKGTLLTAVAARYDGYGDWGNIDTMMRISTDQGKTWQPKHVVTDDGVNTVDNATYIVDPRDDKIYLLYQINYDRAYMKISDDEGERWSSPREITSVFEVFRDRDGYPWTVCAMGPGHGIVLKNGRFVVPVWLSTEHRHRPSISATIYSDDQGKTWHAGETILETTELTPNPSEHVLTELADGRVMSNLRTETKNYCRTVCISPDGATDWSEPEFKKELPCPICMASMVRYSKEENGKGKNRILFCNPTSLEQGNVKTKWGARDRRTVTIRMSEDEGKTWPYSRIIEAGPSGYSDIAVAEDGTIFVIFENGKVDMSGSFMPSRVSVAKFNLAWLMEGDKKKE